MTQQKNKIYFSRGIRAKFLIKVFHFVYFQHLLRRVLENQHKFIQLLQQQTRLCSSNRLQEAVKPEDEADYPKLKTLDPSISYYPVNEPFKHDKEVGDQFNVSSSSEFFRIFIRKKIAKILSSSEQTKSKNVVELQSS